MIPSIEDIFHSLSRGDMSFADAEKYVRAHIELASDHDNMRDLFAGLAMIACMLGANRAFTAEDAATHAKRAYQQGAAMMVERAKQ